MNFFAALVLSFFGFLAVPDPSGWVALERPVVYAEEERVDVEDIWVVFSKRIGKENFTIRFPKDPVYRYFPEGMEIFVSRDSEKFHLFVFERTAERASISLRVDGESDLLACGPSREMPFDEGGGLQKKETLCSGKEGQQGSCRKLTEGSFDSVLKGRDCAEPPVQDVFGFERRLEVIQAIPDTFLVQAERISSDAFNLVYKTKGKWVWERVFFTENHVYIIQTTSFEFSDENPHFFADSLHVESLL